ncbi:Formate dehydrogenase, nitrate-inducible, cytochrome b556(Fdn) subunit [bacterium HR39]|nr:Formate dehydrogenase, nitrate-inducible, cytochrome b556(Fdn) subunit [bacterium HR39]
MSRTDRIRRYFGLAGIVGMFWVVPFLLVSAQAPEPAGPTPAGERVAPAPSGVRPPELGVPLLVPDEEAAKDPARALEETYRRMHAPVTPPRLPRGAERAEGAPLPPGAGVEQLVHPPLSAPIEARPPEARVPPPGPQALPVTAIPQPARTDMWRDIRRGVAGYVPVPDPVAGIAIQSEGEAWRTVRLGAYRAYAAWFLALVVALLAVFYILRGRIRLDHPPTGIRIPRFNVLERFTHWLTAVCFIVLAITGLNLMYGRDVLMPLLGKETFAALTMWGKQLHDSLAFGFMLGVALMFVQWVWYNLPTRVDIQWLLRGGGLFGGGHPPAWKFNAGQKLIFWIVVLGGLSLSMSGLQLLFPYQFHYFDTTFRILNEWFGTNLPTGLTPIAEQQLATLWHGTVATFMIGVILAHIYIGSLGMEGAFGAMWDGEVDLEWAREHHSLWVEQLERQGVLPQAAE